MIYPMWRLSEDTPDNLGLAFTDDGLLLGRTPLIERRNGCFVVREWSEIVRLVKHSFPDGVAADQLMPGLARIAAALNANDQALARIAAVHLQIPDLPSVGKRNAMIAEDALIKYARDQAGDSNWNPALHPRAGVPPNPGWFAPTDGPHVGSSEAAFGDGQSRTQIAENQDGSSRTDAAAPHPDWVRLPPRADRIDELADFLEWFANAKPEDDKALRREIKRYFYDVGDRIGGDQLTAALAHVTDPDVDRETRQQILNDLEPHSRSDPAIEGQIENLLYLGLSFLLPGGLPRAPRGAPKSPTIPERGAVEPSPTERAIAIDTAYGYTPAQIWNLGFTKRGQIIHEIFDDGSLPPLFRIIDKFDFATGEATSTKSIGPSGCNIPGRQSLHVSSKYLRQSSD
jgi:hypothetical protein